MDLIFLGKLDTHLVREVLVADLHGHQLVVDPPSVYRLLQICLQPLVLDDGLGWLVVLSIIYPLVLIDCGYLDISN